MNWLTERFRKKDEQEMYPVHDWRGALVCEAWKPDTWSISYLLWAEPKGEA